MRAAAFRLLLLAARSRAHDSAAAVAASRRLALAVFVAVRAPAEASGVFTNRAGLKTAVDVDNPWEYGGCARALALPRPAREP